MKRKKIFFKKFPKPFWFFFQIEGSHTKLLYIKGSNEGAIAIQMTKWWMLASTANDAIDKEIYGQILRTSVVPVIQQHFFWPNLASAHYISLYRCFKTRATDLFQRNKNLLAWLWPPFVPVYLTECPQKDYVL